MEKFFKKNNFILISIGAFPAAIFRWQMDEIFIVNIIGCFVIGFVYYMPLKNRLRLIIILGFCGSLTTFSGWIVQCIQLLFDGLIFQSICLIVYMFIMGLLAAYLGNFISRRLFR